MFALRNLSVLAYANGFTLWHYRGTDISLDAIAARGFFADAADLLSAGDLMMVSGRDGARILCVAPEDEISLAALA